MRMIKQFVSVIIALFQIMAFVTNVVVFADYSDAMVSDNKIMLTIDYLQNTRINVDDWSLNNNKIVPIADICEFVYDNTEILSEETYRKIDELIIEASDYLWSKELKNVDILSKYLYFENLRSQYEIDLLSKCQNPDGGFGLAEGYTSDIIDTKLACATHWRNGCRLTTRNC